MCLTWPQIAVIAEPDRFQNCLIARSTYVHFFVHHLVEIYWRYLVTCIGGCPGLQRVVDVVGRRELLQIPSTAVHKINMAPTLITRWSYVLLVPVVINDVICNVIAVGVVCKRGVEAAAFDWQAA